MPMRGPHALVVSFVFALLGFGSFASAQTVTINNGLAPPNLDNVIDGTQYPGVTTVNVLALGCIPTAGAENCQHDPEVPQTRVAIIAGGAVSDDILVFGNAHLDMSGGNAADVWIFGSQRQPVIRNFSFRFFDQVGAVEITGGVFGPLHVEYGGWLRLRGGSPGPGATSGSLVVNAYAASVHLEGGSLPSSTVATVYGAEILLRGGDIGGLFDLGGTRYSRSTDLDSR